jgi:hypothetical protein
VSISQVKLTKVSILKSGICAAKRRCAVTHAVEIVDVPRLPLLYPVAKGARWLTRVTESKRGIGKEPAGPLKL